MSREYTGPDPQPGFGFQPGQLIPQAPYIFPGEQELFMLLEMVAQYAGGWPALIAEIVLVILELIDELVLIFTGKPRAQDTLTVAKRLGRGKSPVAHLMSVQIHRNLSQNDIVLSSSDPAAQKILGGIRKQAEASLEAMGTPAARAKSVVDQVWNQTTAANQPLPLELNVPLPQGFTLIGPKAIQDDYIKHYNARIQQGYDPLQAAKRAQNWIYSNSKMGDLGKIQVRPQPKNPPCPTGQHWDPGTSTCVPDVVTPTCPPGQCWDSVQLKCVPMPTAPQPCQPNPLNPGDELTAGLDCVSQNLLVIQYQLANLSAGGGLGGGNLDPVTCAQLSTVVSTLNSSLAAIGDAITAAAAGAAPGEPVDLTAVVQALTALANSAAALPVTLDTNAQAVGSKLDNIASAIASAPAADVAGIVEQLKTIAFQGDVPQPTLDALAAAGFLNSDDLQILQGAPWSKVLSWIEATKAYRSWEKYMRTVGAKPPTLGTDITAAPSPTIDWATAKITGALTTERNFIQDIIAPILKQVRTALQPAGATQIDVIGVNPDTVLADVAAVALNMEVLSMVVGMAFPGAAEQLERITEVATGLLGLEELREVQLGPLVRYGIARVAEMQAKATFKQELPGTTAIQGLVAQGLLDRTRARAIVQLNGTPDELEPAMQASAYRGLNPRQMLRLIQTGLFSDVEIADELTFAGMRPTSQHRMLKAAPYLATAGARSALRGTIEKAAAEGLLSDSDLTARIDAAETDTDRDSLIVARVHLEQLISASKDLEIEYTELFIGDLMTDDLYRANLAGLGLQPWKVNVIAGKAEARANATLRKQTMAAERALERATESKAREAAKKNFIAGTIDAAGLATALLATGLTPAQTAAWVDLALLGKAGAPRWLYGLQLSPQASILLRERVAALTDQRKRNLIPDSQFVDALKTLGLPPREINALRAAANAMLSPKASATVTPVETN